jgi:hypothetical protein
MRRILIDSARARLSAQRALKVFGFVLYDSQPR